MHGQSALRRIRDAALKVTKTPRQDGDETVWLNAFLDARVKEMRTEEASTATAIRPVRCRPFFTAS